MQYTDSSNEIGLVRRLREGDGQAYSLIFKKYWFELYKQAAKKLRSKEEAEEIVQMLFFELWKNREQLHINNLTNFLKVSLRNKCVDRIRVRIREGKYSDYYKKFIKTSTNDTLDQISTNELTDTILKGLTLLPQKSQTVFHLSKLEGFSIKEIAGKLHLSEKTVEYHLTKALKIIRICLKDYVLIILSFLHF
jgi:RNA polymerase sigma-70 factor (family 1)